MRQVLSVSRRDLTSTDVIKVKLRTLYIGGWVDYPEGCDKVVPKVHVSL